MGCIGIEREPEYAAVANMRVFGPGEASDVCQEPVAAPNGSRQKLLF
jgi:hypothetical protein